MSEQGRELRQFDRSECALSGDEDRRRASVRLSVCPASAADKDEDEDEEGDGGPGQKRFPPGQI